MDDFDSFLDGDVECGRDFVVGVHEKEGKNFTVSRLGGVL
jgi:hypothetical protein